jgi:hypothetical protein
MTDPNYFSEVLRAYETTEGDAVLTAADSASYTFGQYDTSKTWKYLSGTNRTRNYYKYAYRNTFIVKENDIDFDIYQIDFDPTTAQFLVDILGKVTEDGIGADVHSTEILHTGVQTPINLRVQLRGGTNPTHAQAQGAFCVSCTLTSEVENDSGALHVTEGWAFELLKDIDDYVIVTTPPIIAGGADVPGIYYLNSVVYDYGGGGAETLEIGAVQVEIKANFSKKTDGTLNIVRKHTFEKIILTISGDFLNDTLWDAWRDRGVVDFRITWKKDDGTNYIIANIVNCNPLQHIKEGVLGSGMPALAIFECEDINGEFTFEGATAFGTIFKGVMA